MPRHTVNSISSLEPSQLPLDLTELSGSTVALASSLPSQPPETPLVLGLTQPLSVTAPSSTLSTTSTFTAVPVISTVPTATFAQSPVPFTSAALATSSIMAWSGGQFALLPPPSVSLPGVGPTAAGVSVPPAYTPSYLWPTASLPGPLPQPSIPITGQSSY